MIQPVTIPLLNPNETEARLVQLFVGEGEFIRAGAPFFILETTKTTAEIIAEVDGYVQNLCFQPGDFVEAGEVLAYLSDSPHANDEEQQIRAKIVPGQISEVEEEILTSLRITQPALALVRQHHLDLATLPKDQFITRRTIVEILDQQMMVHEKPSAAQSEQLSSIFDPTRIVVYGGGGHGKSLIELLQALHVYEIVGVIDDGLTVGESVMGIAALGGYEVLGRLYEQGVRLAVNAVGGIGNLAIRAKVFKRLSVAGFNCPAVIHPTAFIEPSARLSGGVQVFPKAYIGSEVAVGYGTIVNTGAIVSHECKLGNLVNISPGAILAGGVEIGDEALIGMGVTVNLRVQIGAKAKIGNSATVKSDVPEGQIIRAGSTWPVD